MKQWTWNRLVTRYLADKGKAGWAPGTLEAAARWLKKFLLWCNENALTSPAQVTAEHIEHYRQYLLCVRTPRAGFYALNSVTQAMGMLRQFFQWALDREHLLFSPTQDLLLPRIETRMVYLTPVQVATAFEAVEGGTPAGLRDRALLEIFYRGGVRRNECLRLTVADVDLVAGQLRVPGRNARTVALAPELQAALDRYLAHARPELLGDADHDALFVSTVGTPYATATLGQMFQRVSVRAGFRVTAHMLRHAFAVHRIEAGADLAEVAELLGLRVNPTGTAYADIATAALKRRARPARPAAERRRLTHFSSLTENIDER